MLQYIVIALFLVIRICDAKSQFTNQWQNRSTIVHLFEWKWVDIARECEEFLAPKGYGGVQISPPSENLIVRQPRRPWWERYQVMSYHLVTRSGNEDEFIEMTRRCNDVGIRIYADVVINHMTGENPNHVGTGGSTADFKQYSYPVVPYIREHFHPPCSINNYDDPNEVRNCQLVGLKDLNQSEEYVRHKILDYMNKLIDFGVAGFRVDAAKHMYPADLRKIYENLNNLNTKYGFKENSKPYIYQEVIAYGNEPIGLSEYVPLGAVTEFRVGSELSRAFSGRNLLKWLKSWGPPWGLTDSDSALIFIDNHDNQRGHGGGSHGVLTYKQAREYKAAIAFMLAHPYGEPKIMSSFHFDSTDQGPPMDQSDNIASPTFNEDDSCSNGWVCEHRWRQMYAMVGFKNAVRDTPVTGWWDNGANQIAYCRGDKGFVAFNIERYDLNQTLQTCLQAGRYCDVISGTKSGSQCSGRSVTVQEDGRAHIFLRSSDYDVHLAIHTGSQSKL